MFNIEKPVLAIDIGRGTQDILLYEPGQNIENSIKMVLPSPNVVVGKEIRNAASAKKSIHLTGYTMGGGQNVFEISKALQNGIKITATKKAALTIKDNIDAVKDKGILILEDEHISTDTKVIKTRDYMKDEIQNILSAFSIDYPENIAIAVQDHGFSKDVSNRIFRFRCLNEMLDKNDWQISSLAQDPPLPSMTRMHSVLEQCPGALVTDTGPAAIMGALCDPVVLKMAKKGLTLVNAGNGHTLAFTIKGTEILGIFEHHTGSLSQEKMNYYLNKLRTGTITNEEVFEDGGHGASVRKNLDSEYIAVTGPNQNKILPDAYHASPFGDMMLSGCFGLLKIWDISRT
ncbi:pyruvate formate lyase-activating protein [Methanoplanus sp. FWC-SCC4]|uniref:Pyruvate formate lyase-activating protein n=1 Tax=Methanochimaera problematica TaxID=2609417 RepID=A0AA97FEY0_9EURY|nr:DUF1786 domain-containing protein [Methanoplanus sp. FWC-SCC4]WOF16191.1 pyruvate formate lyase-activating protein [Methanoplanus sp. FWC-SCC4]